MATLVVLGSAGATSALAAPASPGATPTPPQSSPSSQIVCNYQSGTSVSALCEGYRQEFGLGGSGSTQGAIASPQVYTPETWCQDEGLAIEILSVNGNSYMDVGLAAYEAGPWWCYELIVTQNANNKVFDSDDYWFLTMRVWVCGKSPTNYYQDSDMANYGPDAWVFSPVLNYGTCGPQADSSDYDSYVMIDGNTRWVPYVSI